MFLNGADVLCVVADDGEVIGTLHRDAVIRLMLGG
jgi:hypothetical protein